MSIANSRPSTPNTSGPAPTSPGLSRLTAAFMAHFESLESADLFEQFRLDHNAFEKLVQGELRRTRVDPDACHDMYVQLRERLETTEAIALLVDLSDAYTAETCARSTVALQLGIAIGRALSAPPKSLRGVVRQQPRARSTAASRSRGYAERHKAIREALPVTDPAIEAYCALPIDAQDKVRRFIKSLTPDGSFESAIAVRGRASSTGSAA